MAIDLLQGAYDIHIHCAPDVVPRSQDLLEVAQAASQAQMAGIVLKDHTGCTAGRAYTLSKLYPAGPRFFGALALNPPVGGLNPVAVDAALRAGADIVYFPTYAAQHDVATLGPSARPALPVPQGRFKGITIFTPSGAIKSQVKTILDLIARHDAVLATGHLSPVESLALLDLARQCGVQRMIVTHASESVPGMPVAQQQQAVALGAVIEHSMLAVTDQVAKPVSLATICEQIRQVGIQHMIVSSDFGKRALGSIVEGFANSLADLQALGFTAAELRVMIVDNPRKLLEDGKSGRRLQ